VTVPLTAPRSSASQYIEQAPGIAVGVADDALLGSSIEFEVGEGLLAPARKLADSSSVRLFST
jgi:hypothetical protein